MKPLKELKERITTLPRGGYLVDTSAGYIQFGSPPETIKDTMFLPQSVPSIFVLPTQLFDWKKGINLADLEFPIYYNYFFKNKKTHIICTSKQVSRIMKALQEALFGPKELFLTNDIFISKQSAPIPDLKGEMDYFRRNLHFRDVLTLNLFRNGQASLDPVKIRLDQNNGFEVFEDNNLIARIPGTVKFRPMYQIGERLPDPFRPPLFGVTCLGPSHGFDPTANTSGFIIWLNHSGIMIDPPINSTEWLNASNVNPKLIDSIILTHCHADHDAGTFQKILEEGKITVYSSMTVMKSFLKKYSSLTEEPVSYLTRLFDFHPIYIGKPVFMHGGEFNFFYTLHSIPTIGFTLKFQDQSFVYSSDHQASPTYHRKLLEEKIITKERYLQLQNFPWHSKVIYHEAGIGPLHTSISFLNSLPKNIQKKTVVYHIAEKDFPEETDLTLATFGIENTLYFDTRKPPYEKPYLILGVLKHLDFLESMPVEKAQEFVSIIEKKKFKKGQTIIKKGTPGDKFFIIYYGNAAIMDEELITKKILGPYEYFGEVALLSEVPRTADVIAETDVSVYTIDMDLFISFIYGTEFEKTLRRLIANRSSETWNIMSTSPLLQSLTTYQKTWLESILSPLELQGPGVLLKEGKSLAQVFIIRRGEVEVSKQGKKIATLGRGDFIGAMHKIQRGELAEYTITHEGPLSLFAIERDAAQEFLERNPGLGMKLIYDF